MFDQKQFRFFVLLFLPTYCSFFEMRLLLSIFASSAFAYLLAIVAFLIFAFGMGQDVREGGFLMVSPLAILLIGLLIPAAAFGIVSGALIGYFWEWVRESANRVWFALILATGFLLLFAAGASLSSRELVSTIVIWIIMVAANVASTTVTKKIYP